MFLNDGFWKESLKNFTLYLKTSTKLKYKVETCEKTYVLFHTD